MLQGLKDGWYLKATNENCLITSSTQTKNKSRQFTKIDGSRNQQEDKDVQMKRRESLM